jgi:hypothetical protein
MLKHISSLRARGAEIMGNGSMLKVLLASTILVVVAFVVVALVTH